jgi:hypothetical protein
LTKSHEASTIPDFAVERSWSKRFGKTSCVLAIHGAELLRQRGGRKNIPLKTSSNRPQFPKPGRSPFVLSWSKFQCTLHGQTRDS